MIGEVIEVDDILRKCVLCRKEFTLGKNSPHSKSKEHIFPQWLLKKYPHLKDEKKTFSTLDFTKKNTPYTKTKIFCCKECNNTVMAKVEDDVLDIISKPTMDYSDDEIQTLVIWMSKIFYCRTLLDYKYEEFNYDIIEHLNPIYQYFYATLYYKKKVQIDRNAYSFFSFETTSAKFDYMDNIARPKIYIQLLNRVYIVVFNDGRYFENTYSDLYSKIRQHVLHYQQAQAFYAGILTAHLGTDIKFMNHSFNDSDKYYYSIKLYAVDGEGFSTDNYAYFMSYIWNSKLSENQLNIVLKPEDFIVDKLPITFFFDESESFIEFNDNEFILPPLKSN